jgi:hypothetical protein
MNDQQLENKISQDIVKVKKDLNTTIEDSATRFGRFEDRLGHATGKAKEDLTLWVGNGVSHLSAGFEKMTDDVKETVMSATAIAKRGVGHGLSQYNTKAQEVADKVPGGFGKKAAGYPWVSMTIALVLGLVLGSLFRPARQHIG